MTQAEDIQHIRAEVSEIKTVVTRLETVWPDVREKVAEHDRCLYGANSGTGLVAEVAEIKRDRKRRERRQAGVLSAVAAGVAAATTGLMKWITG